MLVETEGKPHPNSNGNRTMNRLNFRNSIRLLLIVTLFLGTLTLTSLGAIMSTANAQVNKPTIVFVHGAFAESSSWNGVLTKPIAKGYPTVAVANPLRGVKSDADYVASARLRKPR
jgi:pimeloyl-ACP methyl ester carboxylesterase